jgi:hypothetical protein
MTSPIVYVNEQNTTYGIDATPGTLVTIRLADTAGVTTWDCECASTDGYFYAAAQINALLGPINTIAKSRSFTMPAGAGQALIFFSTVNNGLAGDQPDESLTTRFEIHSLTAEGLRTIAVDESLESDPSHGWASKLNPYIRSRGSLSADILWAPTVAPDVSVESIQQEVTTTSATTTTAVSFTQANETLADYTATVMARSTVGDNFGIDLRATYESTNGTFSTVRTPATSNPLTANPAWTAAIDRSGSTVRVRVTGEAGKTVRWSVAANSQLISLTSAPVAFDLSTLSLSLWFKYTFTGSPWTSSASAGASGGRTASEATHPPTAATALNGRVGAAFTTNQLLTASVIESSAFTAAAGTISILYKANAGQAAADPSSALGDAGLIQGAGGYFAVSVNATGARFLLDDNATSKKISIAATHDGSTWHLAQMKWDGTNLKCRVDSGAWSSLACGNMGNLTSAIKIGCNYSGAYFYPGIIQELVTSATALSDANCDNIKSYVNATYGLSL